RNQDATRVAAAVATKDALPEARSAARSALGPWHAARRTAARSTALRGSRYRTTALVADTRMTPTVPTVSQEPGSMTSVSACIDVITAIATSTEEATVRARGPRWVGITAHSQRAGPRHVLGPYGTGWC